MADAMTATAAAPEAASRGTHSPLPQVALPKGGGAIRGVGEKFSVNAATGTGSMTVPLAASPGRAGFGPQLSLAYDSGAGNGSFGFGWSLSLPSITRKTDKGLPRYRDGDESDDFLVSGAEDLVPILDAAGNRVSFPRTVHNVDYRVSLYRPRIEGLFARIERWTRTVGAEAGVTHWRTITRDNVTTLFGIDESSRVRDPAAPRRIYSWLIALTWDDKGNATRYEYRAEDAAGVDVSAAHEANRTSAARGAQRYVKRVRYGNAAPYFPTWAADGDPTPLPAGWHFQVVFDYGDHRAAAPTPVRDPALDPVWPVRVDPFSSYRAGFEVRTYRRCERVLLFHQFAGEEGFDEPCLVRSTDFTYSDEAQPADPRSPIYTFLESVTQRGYRRDGAGGSIERAAPPVEFYYSQPEVHDEVLTLDDPDSRANLPEGIDGARFQMVDLDGEGLSGILTERAGGWGYKRNLSPINHVTLPNGKQVARARFGPMEDVRSLPVPSSPGGAQQLIDLTGEGRPDLVAFDASVPGYFERTADEGWAPLRPFFSLPRLNWSEPNLKFVDLSGDGRADVLITGAEEYTVHESLGILGFGAEMRIPTPGDERRGPRVVFADGEHAVSLADMSGDGLSDIVRVRAGEVCYWPNLGYGRFGPMVTMDGAPRFDSFDCFDARRLRFADIDGSGTTDLLYLADDGVQVYFNRSGNSWATAQRLAVFPAAADLTSVQVMDLLGNGTSCLVWSSTLPGESYAPLRYVDLMGSVKPHLLVRSRNNLGAETRLAYAPSTRFYLEDQRAGRPWITRLPFPVQTVERVETYDWIGRSRFVTRYAYHHGYFDGEEREFRGFGMVEEWDTEAHRDDTLFPGVDAANESATSHVPPTCTRTWFHTGAFVEAGAVSRQYASEYWVEPAARGDAPANVAAREALLLPDTVLEGALDADQTREAYRALKGSPLRVEVYAEDNSVRAEHPYSVTETTLAVRLVQPRGPNRHAVFLAHPRESVAYHYERQPDDPRLSHDVTLEVDGFGNVRRSATVAYGRRQGYPDPEPTLSAAFRAMLTHDQTRLHVGATEHAFTLPVNRLTDAVAVDAYRGPLPCETITAELTGIAPAGSRFTVEELDGHWATLWDGTHDIPYEEVSTPDIEGVGVPVALARRIVARSRTLYRSTDLTALLPLGTAHAQALTGESYRLALTPGLVARVFGGGVNDAMLTEGGYVQLAGQPDWWIPSGRIFHSSGAADPPAAELAEARAHFYLLRRAVDPLGSVSRVRYDAHDLLLVESTDALGSIVAADNDYRVLQPMRATDPNGNVSEVALDCLGHVVGTAFRGKNGEGDTLAGFIADLPDAQVQAIMADPRAAPAAAVGSATSRLVIDDLAYFRTRDLPAPDAVGVCTIVRETHAADLAPGASTRCFVVVAYSDGFGREIQHKAQAEDGLVPGLPGAGPRWVASGWTIYNNKGKPVRKYEPFFSRHHRFEFKLAGVSSVLFYDPAERVIGTLHPDFTFEKTVFDAWREEAWDANDTVRIDDPRADGQVGDFFRRIFGPAPGAYGSWYTRRIGGALGATPGERAANQDAAQKAELHRATPRVSHFDSVGRACLSVVDNGTVGAVAQRYPTRTAMDTESKPLSVFDARGRRVMEYCLREVPPGGGPFRYVAGYDVAGSTLYRNAMDTGERRTLGDAVGRPMRAWDAQGAMFRFRHDALHRLTHRYVTRAAAAERLVERCVYGERHPDAARNLKGRMFRHYDNAGVATNARYDFKGNLVESSRQLARIDLPAAQAAFYETAPDWSPIDAVVDVPALDVAALDAASAPLLIAADTFTASGRFDAMNRPTQMVTPHAAGARPSVVQPTYNVANLLDAVDVWIRLPAVPAARLDPGTADVHSVTDVEYDEHGRRARVVLGNQSVTVSEYDPQTSRLAFITTTRPGTLAANARTVQALAYHYDPVGNVTRLRDMADIQNVVFFQNRRVEPSTDYRYDASYRLVAATGREHLGQAGGGALAAAQQVQHDDSFRAFTTAAARGDGNAMGAYTETYAYDPVGNILEMMHLVASGGWTRRYSYDEPSLISAAERSNRLSSTSLPGDPVAGPYSATYAHDVHGNMTRMPHLPRLTWDDDDHMQSSTRQLVNAGMPETTYYGYDSEGQRVRKVTAAFAAAGQAPVRRTERLYLGVFELYREYDGGGNVVLARETLNVLLDHRRVAMVETLTAGVDAGPARLVRYQYANHVGSSALELDEAAEVISYEEYFPFGSTSYQAVRAGITSRKRYRYTGRERDEETDLYYHGARYYASWLGRWTAADPAGLADGPNLYMYVHDNPVALSDPTGMWGWREVAIVAAVVVVGTVVTVATAGVAGPIIAGAVASVGLSGAAATVATGVVVGAVAGAAGGAAGELTRQVASGEEISGRNIAKAALVGAALGAVTGGIGAYATTARGAAQAAGAGRAIAASSVGRAGAAVGRTVVAGARAVARVPGVRQAVAAVARVGRGGASALQGLERGAENLGLRGGRALFTQGGAGRQVVDRFAQTRSIAGAFDAAAPRVFRVQGGVPPAASRARIGVGAGGELEVQGRAMLHVTFEDAGHTRYFLGRRPGAQAISFEVDPAFVSQVRTSAVPQAQARAFPGMPQIDDPTMTASAFGLGSSWQRQLEAAAVPGTGRIGGLGLINNQSSLVSGVATGVANPTTRDRVTQP